MMKSASFPTCSVPTRSSSPSIRAPAMVMASSARSRDIPARTPKPAERKKKRLSVMPSSVWKAVSTPARSSAAPLVLLNSSASSFPPGESRMMMLAGARGGDLVRHLPRLAHVMQHHAKAELARKPQRREDVVGAVGVKVDHAAAVQHLRQRLELQVSRRDPVGRAGGADLLAVLLRPHEAL